MRLRKRPRALHHLRADVAGADLKAGLSQTDGQETRAARAVEQLSASSHARERVVMRRRATRRSDHVVGDQEVVDLREGPVRHHATPAFTDRTYLYLREPLRVLAAICRRAVVAPHCEYLWECRGSAPAPHHIEFLGLGLSSVGSGDRSVRIAC